jgi:hypothetical protein
MQTIHSFWQSLHDRFTGSRAPHDDGLVAVDGPEYFSEDHFQKMLILERKRAERFGIPFMLTLLNVGQLFEENRHFKRTLLDGLSLALRSATREIDVKGWYIRNFLLGIIFPDVQPQNRNSVLYKINRMLYSSLTAENAKKIETLCLFYPGSPEQQIPLYSRRIV